MAPFWATFGKIGLLSVLHPDTLAIGDRKAGGGPTRREDVCGLSSGVRLESLCMMLMNIER